MERCFYTAKNTYLRFCRLKITESQNKEVGAQNKTTKAHLLTKQKSKIDGGSKTSKMHNALAKCMGFGF